MLARAVYPLCRIIGTAATGGIYAAPTNDPLGCCNRKVAGGACPAPTAQGFLLPRRTGCSTSLKCARTAGTPDLLFIIYYLLFNPSHPPVHASSPIYRTPSAPFSPCFVQSGQNAHFTPKNMCNILRKTPLRMGSLFGTIKLCKSAFLQVRPEQNLDVCAKRRGPVRVPRTDCKSL